MAKLHLANGNHLYYENGKAVTVNGYPVKRWENSNNRWSACGREVKDFKGKNILDLEKILWSIYLEIKKTTQLMCGFLYSIKMVCP